MPALADAQAAFRRAITADDTPQMAGLIAPTAIANRLAIYRRHYREGLSRHLAGRFPTLAWLLGALRLSALTEHFTRLCPPSAPCLAEYGFGFAAFLSGDAAAAIDSQLAAIPYAADVAALDWHLGDVSVAIDLPAIAIDALAQLDPARLPDLVLRLQPGLRYLNSAWPIDDLVRIRMSEQAPERLVFAPLAIALEARGARGQFDIRRLGIGTQSFRSAVASGATLGGAAELGLAAEPGFDVSVALASLFAEGLVTALDQPVRG